MYCSNCGQPVLDKAAACLHCGAAIRRTEPVDQSPAHPFWWILGFLLPTAGLLIWAFCYDTTPNKAKSAGIGALVGFIVSVVLVVLFYVLYFLGMGLLFFSFY